MHDMYCLGEDAVFIYDLKIGNGTERSVHWGIGCVVFGYVRDKREKYQLHDNVE
jgi:hypothetical protein